MTRRLEEVFSLLAVSRGVRDHRGSFFVWLCWHGCSSCSTLVSFLLKARMVIVVLGRPRFTRVVRLFWNSLAILMAFLVGVLRARSFLRLRLPVSACSIRALTSLETAFSLWPFVLSFAHFLLLFDLALKCQVSR